jgi:hypothetical protein
MTRFKIVLLIYIVLSIVLKAETHNKYDIMGGFLFQKTHYLYSENGLGFDISSNSILEKKIHLKFAYLSSRFGSAINSNAIKQDNITLGADWRFRSEHNLQILAGINTGFFIADYEDPTFEVLPNTALLLSVESGLVYNFDFPISTALTAGYNLRIGNGDNVPGSIFPFFYRLSVYYRF